MPTKPNRITKEFYFKLDEKDYSRHATIVFIDNRFDHCNFKTNKSIYDLDDWQFLNKLSEFILNLEKEKNENLR